MSKHENPYIGQCAFCKNGLLRFMRCDRCETVAAVCDECELVWRDIEAVSGDPSRESSCAYPACPSCDTQQSTWSTLAVQEVQQAGLQEFVTGESE